jgi:hypothetical protein
MAGSEFDPADAPVPQPETPAADAPQAPAPEPSAAVQRFRSCRWREAAEDAVPDHCTHRDVQPMAGTTGFDPDAWCPDCGYYKVRRNPRKRPPQTPEDRYYY